MKAVIGELKAPRGIVSVVMAGGQGTRFWPLGRSKMPKQYLPLPAGKGSLIEATIRRMEAISGPGSVLVVTASDQVELVQKAVPDVAVLIEPRGRNTAPCAAYAAQFVWDELGDFPLVMVPADHIIANEAGLTECLLAAVDCARSNDVLVTVGIVPNCPETGYGYIESGAALSPAHCSSDDIGIYKVERFVEKPDLKTAQDYVSSGRFLWNSGMFAWRPSAFLAQVRKSLPILGQQVNELSSLYRREDALLAIDQVFGPVSSISVDYGVMEKAEHVVVVTAGNLGWSDVGSWKSWADAAGSGDISNLEQGDVMLIDSEDCLVLGDKKLIAGVGLKGLVVIDTPDALLIVPKERAQDVREVVSHLREVGRKELL